MCGLLGSIDIRFTKNDLDLIRHRGPDDDGLIEVNCYMHKMWLGHRRLSIVDLSQAGHQPMTSECGNYVLIYNGEVYNHEDVRKTLKQKHFKGHSDTETILYALKENGIKAAENFNGIFAFAFLDLSRQQLIITRDFFGVKPLYYCLTNEGFIFSSEIRPIRALLNNNVIIDKNSLSTLLRLRYIPSPYTLFQNIYKVRPGHFIEINLSKRDLNPIEKSLNINVPDSFSGTFDDAVIQYNEIFSASVKRQLMSDVEIGIMLSGGVDSAMVASIAKRNSLHKIKAFTVGFTEKSDSDEIKNARKTAKLLNLEHHIIKVNDNHYHDLFAQCVEIIEEPTATTSIIPFYFLSKLASEQVKVVLTGQGADEPLGGYFRYKEELIKQSVPSFILNTFCSVLDRYSVKNEKLRRAFKALPIQNDVQRFDEAYSVFSYKQIDELIGRSNSRAIETIQYNYNHFSAKELSQSALRMMKIDARMNLADDLLNYTDKISMHFALETRVPLLDTELVSFIESLPLSFKMNLFNTKIIHKKSARNIIPKTIINRRKKGFQSPTNIWFRREIETIGDLLINSNSKFSTIFNGSEISKIINLHRKGFNMEKQLFVLLSIYYWIERN